VPVELYVTLAFTTLVPLTVRYPVLSLSSIESAVTSTFRTTPLLLLRIHRNVVPPPFCGFVYAVPLPLAAVFQPSTASQFIEFV
jgi:hypothetical protein